MVNTGRRKKENICGADGIILKSGVGSLRLDNTEIFTRQVGRNKINTESERGGSIK